MEKTGDDSEFQERHIAWQFGSEVVEFRPGEVFKCGAKVKPLEETAMRLVQAHIPSIPIPELGLTTYTKKNGKVHYGEIYMDLVPGQTLKAAWAGFDDATKARICQAIWDAVALIRTVPRPAALRPEVTGVYCTADGSPSLDPLLGDNNDDVTPPFADDQAFRERIYERYVKFNGLSYRDPVSVLDLLPRSDKAVFAHGDIGPRNIMVDAEGRILAFLDWESSGWFPDYWEFCQMMKPCSKLEREWQAWMDRTKPEPWDITGITKTRRVLF